MTSCDNFNVSSHAGMYLKERSRKLVVWEASRTLRIDLRCLIGGCCFGGIRELASVDEGTTGLHRPKKRPHWYGDMGFSSIFIVMLTWHLCKWL